MSISPIITFKAGVCELDYNLVPPKVIPKPTPGFIYLYSEDDLVHFCWRPRPTPLSQPELDLVMVPSDGHFTPYKPSNNGTTSKPPTNGRLYVLKFSSSSQRHLFWLQSKSQHPQGDPSFFSPRDLKIGQIVDQLLQGEEIDVEQEIANLPSNQDRQDGDNDETMEDVEGASDASEHHRAASGGAGAGATGGDFREEGQGSREGGADGGRAALAPTTEAATAVANFLQSLQGNQALASQQNNPQPRFFTTLPDLLPPSSTVPIIDSADQLLVNSLLAHVPPTLLLLAQEADDISSVDPTPGSAKAAIEALSLEQKREILRKILRSPQFSQSLGSLTMALRDGGLPSISEALKVKVQNGGFLPTGGAPVGGGDAVEAFLNGIKSSMEDEPSNEEGQMDTD